MGLFDTVASVGGPALHLDWASELAIPPEVERCVHYVAAHEVRYAFQPFALPFTIESTMFCKAEYAILSLMLTVVLDAQGAWRVVPHNLKLRQEIRKHGGKRRGHVGGEANPIGTYVQEKLAQAKKTRKAATQLAHAMRLLGSAPTVRAPRAPVRPKKLSIGTGQVF
ncbi:hypothetical protein OKW26_003750 [Paraburkholderia sp. 32]